MQRTRLETFRQSRVVVVDDVVVVIAVVVWAYSPITGSRVRQLRGSTPRYDAGPMNPVVALAAPLLDVADMRAGESPFNSCDAPPSLDGDAPPDKGSLIAPGQGSAGDTAPGEGAVGVSKSHLVRSRI